jgi:ABC-2 type transport system ATP-binding protein
VLLTTQYLEEADRLAHRLAVIDRGKLIAEGTSRELKASVGGNTLQVRLESPAQRLEAETLLAAALGATFHNGADPQVLSARIADAALVADAMAALARSGVRVDEFSLGQPSLDEVFFALTGHGAEERDREVVQ